MADTAANLCDAGFIRSPVEAEARGDLAGAVKRAIVSETGGGKEGLIERGPELALGELVADAELNVEARVNVPLDLTKNAVGREVRDVGDGAQLGIVIIALDAGGNVVEEVGNRTEGDKTVGALAEEIIKIVLFALESAGKDEVVQEQKPVDCLYKPADLQK